MPRICSLRCAGQRGRAQRDLDRCGRGARRSRCPHRVPVAPRARSRPERHRPDLSRSGITDAVGRRPSVTRDDVLFLVLPFLVATAVSAGIVVILRQRAASRRQARLSAQARLADSGLQPAARSRRSAARPWWGNPWLWVAVSVVFVALGLFVWPALFGGVFVFLPFVLVGGPKPDRMDPRTNGHSKRGESGVV